MSFNAIELLQNGIYAEPVVDKESFCSLLRQLYPIKSEFELVRIGGVNDGGYLLPNDFEGVDVCFSPGVANNASFELDLFKKTGILSHLADFSVEGPPEGYLPKSFLKKYLGAKNDEIFITLDTWVSSMEIAQSSDLILQMDIEGGEYLTLLNSSIDTLRKFRILVLEVHDIYAWSNRNFFGIVKGFFDKILQYFYVVHNHPNNNDGLLNINGIEVPRTIELTLIRKDRTSLLGYRQNFPHLLDRPNVPSIQDLVLPQFWFATDEELREGENKILLCRPQGGWNDVLCSIERCWEYAIKFNRKLSIDTTHSGINDHFWRYFETKEYSRAINFALDYERYDTLDVFPASLQGRVSSFVTDYSMDKFGFVDTISDELICFNSDIDYPNQLLVHEQGWFDSELGSLKMFNKIRFTNPVKDLIKSRLAELPNKYKAIHIRHTDYTTNYEEFIREIKNDLIGENVLICSDNFQVIDFVVKELAASKVFRLSRFDDNGGSRLHYMNDSNQFETNLEALTDLMALALSDRLYFANVKEANRPSGFSMLAQSLSSRKDLLRNLIF